MERLDNIYESVLSESNFKVGDTIYHPKYGKGVLTFVPGDKSYLRDTAKADFGDNKGQPVKIKDLKKESLSEDYMTSSNWKLVTDKPDGTMAWENNKNHLIGVVEPKGNKWRAGFGKEPNKFFSNKRDAIKHVMGRMKAFPESLSSENLKENIYSDYKIGSIVKYKGKKYEIVEFEDDMHSSATLVPERGGAKIRGVNLFNLPIVEESLSSESISESMDTDLYNKFKKIDSNIIQSLRELREFVAKYYPRLVGNVRNVVDKYSDAVYDIEYNLSHSKEFFSSEKLLPSEQQFLDDNPIDHGRVPKKKVDSFDDLEQGKWLQIDWTRGIGINYAIKKGPVAYIYSGRYGGSDLQQMTRQQFKDWRDRINQHIGESLSNESLKEGKLTLQAMGKEFPVKDINGKELNIGDNVFFVKGFGSRGEKGKIIQAAKFGEFIVDFNGNKKQLTGTDVEKESLSKLDNLYESVLKEGWKKRPDMGDNVWVNTSNDPRILQVSVIKHPNKNEYGVLAWIREKGRGRDSPTYLVNVNFSSSSWTGFSKDDALKLAQDYMNKHKESISGESLKETKQTRNATKVMEVSNQILDEHNSRSGKDLVKYKKEFLDTIKLMGLKLTKEDAIALEDNNYHTELDLLYNAGMIPKWWGKESLSSESLKEGNGFLDYKGDWRGDNVKYLENDYKMWDNPQKYLPELKDFVKKIDYAISQNKDSPLIMASFEKSKKEADNLIKYFEDIIPIIKQITKGKSIEDVKSILNKSKYWNWSDRDLMNNNAKVRGPMDLYIDFENDKVVKYNF